jgi:hypothetical protein
MLDLLAGIQIARKATEEQFAFDARSRDDRRSPVRHLPFFRRSRHEDRAQTAPGAAPRTSALNEPAAEKGR